MKRFLSFVFVLALMLSAVTFAVPANAAVSYNLWLGSTRVTPENKNDILNDGGKGNTIRIPLP